MLPIKRTVKKYKVFPASSWHTVRSPTTNNFTWKINWTDTSNRCTDSTHYVDWRKWKYGQANSPAEFVVQQSCCLSFAIIPDCIRPIPLVSFQYWEGVFFLPIHFKLCTIKLQSTNRWAKNRSQLNLCCHRRSKIDLFAGQKLTHA